MPIYRVLALDGGGIRGLVTATLLRRLCAEPGLEGFLDSVDLIAGTSSGGLIALGLADGLGCDTKARTLEEIARVFEQGHDTFGSAWPWWLGGTLLWAKYGTRSRQARFRKLLGERALGEYEQRVLISAFDLDNEGRNNEGRREPRRWEPKLFHNFDGDNTDRDRLAWKVALYTTAGPTYFPTVDGYIDGGVYSNNPSMCALSQVFDPRYDPRPKPSLDEVVLLSIGTGTNLKFVTGPRRNWGIFRWGTKFVRLTMDGTVGIADYYCKRMLPPDNYRRLEPIFPPGTIFELDALNRIPDLKKFAENVPLDAYADWIRQHWMRGAAPLSREGGTRPQAAAPRPASASGPPNAIRAAGRRDTSRDGRFNTLVFWGLTHLSGLWAFFQRVPLLERLVNAFLINIAIKYAPARPNPLSTRDPYSSWSSMVDRKYFSRHLAPIDPADAVHPDADTVKELFRRPAGAPRLSPKSTALFAYFAQWFTDGFLRSDFSDYPKNVLKNTSNHEIDLCNLYGLTDGHTQILREHTGGRLKSQPIGKEEFPPFYFDSTGNVAPGFADLPAPLLPAKQPVPLARKQFLFAMGGERGNIFTGYAMMNVLFLREHNRIAAELARAYPGWDDDRLFQTTRNVLTVILLKIVVEDYVNHITPYHFKFRLHPGRKIRQDWHRPNWVAIEFNLLYRWHSLVPDEVRIGDALLPMADCVFNTGLLTQDGLRGAFDGATRQQACEIGLFNTTASLLDRAERPTIRLGRLAKLRSYNDYREWCRFPRVTDVGQISSVPEVRAALRDTYRDVDDIELYAGLFAEDLRPNSVLGPLMGRMVGIDALSQALTNPLISPHIYNEATFSRTGLRIVEETRTLNDVVRRNIEDAPIVSFTHAGFRRV